MKKKKNTTESARKIYKDYTLDEYDVMTMDEQCNGAAKERADIIAELQRRAAQVNELSNLAPAGKLDSSVEWSILSYGLEMAVKIIYKMPQYESRCGCKECGAI